MEQQNPNPNNNPTPQQVPIPPRPPKKNNGLNILLVVLIILLLLTNVATVYFLYSNSKKEVVKENPKTNEVMEQKNDKQNMQEENESNFELILDENDGEEIKLAANEILVDWKEWPVKINYTYEIFGDKTTEVEKQFQDNENTQYYDSLQDLIKNNLSIYNAGKISEGVYQDNDLYLINMVPESPGALGTVRVVNKAGDLIILNNNDNGVNEQNLEYLSYGYLFKIDSSTKIKNLDDLPKSIKIPDTNFIFTKADTDAKRMLNNYDVEEKLLLGDTKIYKDTSRSCFLSELNDGMAISYTLGLYFVSEQSDEPSQYLGQKPYLLKFDYLNGEANQNEYLFSQFMHNSFESGCYTYANFINSINQLEEIGKTDNDESIYALKDHNVKEYENDQVTLLEKMYNSIYTLPEEEKISYEDFLADNPILFWQDPFGDYIMFKNAKYVPAAEMGKPVIYLYPEKTTNVAVQVYPNNGLSITEPEYKNGWFVKAEPNGQLYNYDDNKTYPYLFWEGHGLNYKMPQNGFVVEKDNIESFLIEKLSQQGLLKHEYDEFIDFWAPKMSQHEYYFVTFLDQSYFDTLAPLYVNPKPDTVIRVFMDYKGLDKNIEVQPQFFETPQRNGFTVVEWGGALH